MKSGGAKPFALMVCTIRGHHDFVPSRRFEDSETCLHCGLRRKVDSAVWFAAERAKPAQESPPNSAGTVAPRSQGDHDTGARPLALIGCVIRGSHTFMASRRLEGFDTCVHCGARRKADDKPWFKAAPPKPAPPDGAAPEPRAEQADVDEASSVVAISEETAPPQSNLAAGVDPKILREFLRQIDRR